MLNRLELAFSESIIQHFASVNHYDSLLLTLEETQREVPVIWTHSCIHDNSMGKRKKQDRQEKVSQAKRIPTKLCGDMETMWSIGSIIII